MESQNSFITLESMYTFGGLTIAVMILTNTAKSFINIDPKYFAIFFSVIITFIVGWNGITNSMGYLVCFINACLVYCSAMGINVQASKILPETGSPRNNKTVLKKLGVFFKPW